MRKHLRVQKIKEILDQYFPSPQAFLKFKDPYTLLVAVLLSAQCTDDRVNKVTPHLFALADNPFDMQHVSIPKIEEAIRSCGLYKNKAKAISGLSKLIVENFNGVTPSDLDALETLPGVGHKTASVVLCQAFNKPAFPVDTHIHRCAKRWNLSSGKNVIATEKDLKKLFLKESWSKVHLQMISFARMYCPAKKHDKDACPICSWV